MRFAYHRLYGNRVLSASGTRIDGAGNLKVGQLLQVGMINPGFVNYHDRTYINIRGTMEITGRFSIARGCRIDIGNDAYVKIGGGFVNSNTIFVIQNELTIGTGCAISWDCRFIDDNMHSLVYPGKRPDRKGIAVGSNVWIGSGVLVLAGAVIPDNSVVAAGSIVNRAFSESGVLLAGVPAKIVRSGVNWRL